MENIVWCGVIIIKQQNITGDDIFLLALDLLLGGV